MFALEYEIITKLKVVVLEMILSQPYYSLRNQNKTLTIRDQRF